MRFVPVASAAPCRIKRRILLPLQISKTIPVIQRQPARLERSFTCKDGYSGQKERSFSKIEHYKPSDHNSHCRKGHSSASIQRSQKENNRSLLSMHRSYWSKGHSFYPRNRSFLRMSFIFRVLRSGPWILDQNRIPHARRICEVASGHFNLRNNSDHSHLSAVFNRSNTPSDGQRFPASIL